MKINNDVPFFWDAWDIFDYVQNNHKDVLAETATVVKSNEHVAEIEFFYQISEKSTLK